MSAEVTVAIIAGLFGLAAAITTIVYKIITTWPPWVKITGPKTGATVSNIIVVSGESKRVPHEKAIWIEIKTADRYYPMTAAADSKPTGRWSSKWSSKVFVGVNNDEGKQFEIIAVLANENAQRLIMEYFKDSEIGGSWIGQSSLPPGAKAYDRITVTRGPWSNTQTI